MVCHCLALHRRGAGTTRMACRSAPRLVAIEPQGPKEACGGDQGRLRVDLRLPAAGADDVGAEHSLYARIDILVADHVTTDPRPHVRVSRRIRQLVQPYRRPQGRIRIASTAVVSDSGQPDVVAPYAQQHSIQDLPEEALVFLLGADTATRRSFPRRPGACSVERRRAGVASRRSAISCTTTSCSVTSMPAPRERPGKRSTSGAVCRDFAHLAMPSAAA